MTPVAQIHVDGTNITTIVQQHLLSLNITDEAGGQSDKAEVKLDDRNSALALPSTGAKLHIALGYKETTLTPMGIYTVDEVVLASPPQTLTIRARAADMLNTLKAPRTRTWGKVELGHVIQTIANEHNITPRISDDLSNIQLGYLTQTEESDLHLLTRLANTYGAITKPVNDHLLFTPMGHSKSVSGQTIPAITLNAKEITAWQINLTEREKYGAVKATWHNTDTADRQEITTGQAAPTYTMRHTYDTEDQAQQAAAAQQHRLQHSNHRLNLTLPGNPLLAAEATVNITGLRPELTGPWRIIRAEHTLDASGYQTRITADSY